MSGQDIIIEQLRADVERLTKLHGRELLERMEAERERDEWKAKHDTLADVSRSCIATAERERDAARAEREALRRHYDEAGPEHNLLALLDLYDERRAEVERLTAERDEARANYAFMVERAADQKLDGYRELGAKAAAAEERAERAERERDAYKRAKDENDDRFTRERDEARERYARIVEALGVEHTGDTIVHVRVAKRLREDCKRLAFDRDWESDLRRSMQDERDAARANYAFMVERAADQKLDGYRELGARAAAAEERAERAERERDARPDISAEDARAFMMFKPVPARDSREGPVMHALRAHAAKAVNP